MTINPEFALLRPEQDVDVLPVGVIFGRGDLERFLDGLDDEAGSTPRSLLSWRIVFQTLTFMFSVLDWFQAKEADYSQRSRSAMNRRAARAPAAIPRMPRRL